GSDDFFFEAKVSDYGPGDIFCSTGGGIGTTAFSTNDYGDGCRVYTTGVDASAAHHGVHGKTYDTSGTYAGVQGEGALGVWGNTTGGTGVWGAASGGTGVRGNSTGGDGVQGYTSDAGHSGVYGHHSINGKGVFGVSDTAGSGVEGQ